MISALLFMITSFCLSVCIITHEKSFVKYFVCICVYLYYWAFSFIHSLNEIQPVAPPPQIDVALQAAPAVVQGDALDLRDGGAVFGQPRRRLVAQIVKPQILNPQNITRPRKRTADALVFNRHQAAFDAVAWAHPRLHIRAQQSLETRQ